MEAERGVPAPDLSSCGGRHWDWSPGRLALESTLSRHCRAKGSLWPQPLLLPGQPSWAWLLPLLWDRMIWSLERLKAQDGVCFCLPHPPFKSYLKSFKDSASDIKNMRNTRESDLGPSYLTSLCPNFPVDQMGVITIYVLQSYRDEMI